jgi:hypothetical protein
MRGRKGGTEVQRKKGKINERKKDRGGAVRLGVIKAITSKHFEA